MNSGFVLTLARKEDKACRATPVLFVPHAPGFACKPDTRKNGRLRQNPPKKEN
jgi:hypothetical protein